MTSVNLQAAEPGRKSATTALVIEAYQVRVGIRTNQPALLERLLPHLPPGWQIAPAEGVGRWYGLESAAGYRLTSDQETLLATTELTEALEYLESDLQLFVAEMATERVFVHAGVVTIEGQAVLLPGRSYSGKTTLVAALLRAGATYYSDEYAVLDADGLVHPYPRRLSVREASCRWRQRCTAEELGSRPGAGPVPVGLVLFMKYAAAGCWNPERLSPGEGLLALINQTVSIRRRPAAALHALQKVVRAAPVLSGARGEAEAFAQELVRGSLDNFHSGLETSCS